jgi:L-lactate utilization protein LutB
MSRASQFSAVNLYKDVVVDAESWNGIPTPDVIDITCKAIEKRGTKVIPVADGNEALAVIEKLIPPGSEVMSGSSTILIEIGLEYYIAGGYSGWNLLQAKINAEDDSVKRAEIRRKSVTADYFISSANAIAQSGEIVACDAGGSRVGAWPYAAGHLILVVGINKIVPTLEDALSRVREYVFPLENVRAMKA